MAVHGEPRDRPAGELALLEALRPHVRPPRGAQEDPAAVEAGGSSWAPQPALVALGGASLSHELRSTSNMMETPTVSSTKMMSAAKVARTISSMALISGPRRAST